MIDAGKAMMRQHSDVGAIVLECTIMAPYARDLRKVTGLPVYSIYSFISWFQSGLQPRRFDLDLDDPRYV
jgi:Asp/Glu/hydantoin racemase